MSTNHRIAIGGIYAIRHVASGKMYIGSATDLRKRWELHRRQLRDGVHHSRHLQRAFDRHGAGAFVFEVLRAVEDPEDLIRIEREYLDHFRPWDRRLGYNIVPTAGSQLGYRHREETRAEMSRIGKARRLSAAHRASIGAAHRGMKRSAETRARMSAAQDGKTHSAETKARLSEIARNCSAETRARMSAAHEGRTPSDGAVVAHRAAMERPEVRAKIAASNRARVVSADTRARMSEAHKGRRPSPETVARISAARKARRPMPGQPCLPSFESEA